jgi:hypothetical protein
MMTSKAGHEAASRCPGTPNGSLGPGCWADLRPAHPWWVLPSRLRGRQPLRGGGQAAAQAARVMAQLLAILRHPHLGMFQEADHRETHEKVDGAAAGSLAESGGHLLEGVGALAARAPGHEGFERPALPWDGRREPGMIVGAHIDHRSHLGVGLTEDLPGAGCLMGDPVHVPGVVRRTLDGTVGREASALRVMAVTAHGQPGGTPGDALVIDLRGAPGRGGMLGAAGIEGDDRRDVLGLDKVVDAPGILAAVIDHRADAYGERMVGGGFEEAIQARGARGEVGVMGWRHQHL